MNSVAIFFVPTGAKKQDFESALQEHLASLQKEAPASSQANSAAVTDNDQMPLWTWFVSDPRP